MLTFKVSKYTHLELKKVWWGVMEDERKDSPNHCAVKWGVIDSKTNRQKNGQLSWVLNTQNLLLLCKGTTIWFWGGAWKIFLIEIFIFGIFRIKLFIFYIGQIKLFIFIFVVFSILDWSKSEGLKYFVSPSSRSKYLFSTYSRSKYLF